MGFVFVFDMDATIAGDYVYPSLIGINRTTDDIDLNPKIVNLLRVMTEGRQNGKVDAIFLYTNNSDISYISLVESALIKRIPDFTFDNIMSCRDPRRVEKNAFNPKKCLADVITMAEATLVPLKNLETRVFFFDDVPNHKIRDELPEGHYINITPPYSKNNKEDWTDYGLVKWTLADAGLPALNAIRGGKRITRRKRKAAKHKKWATRRLRKPGPKPSQNAL